MDFLRRLFSSYTQEVQVKIEQELHPNTLNQVHLSANSKAQSFPKTSFQSPSLQGQCKAGRLSSEMQAKIIEILQVSQKQPSAAIDCGTLVGVVGLQKQYQQILHKSAIVRIGCSQQINSLRALRKKSLDSLVVFYNETKCQFDLEEFILADQRLIFVVQQRKIVSNLLSTFQNSLLQLFHQRALFSCSNILCLLLISCNQKYYLEFRNGDYFLEHFKRVLKKLNLQFQSTSQYERLMKLITLRDYLDFRQNQPSAISKIFNLGCLIQKDSQDSQRQLRIKGISQLLSTSQNYEKDPIVEPVRKNSSIQADLEAEYFKKRISEKKTGQSEIPELVYSSELFYFIEERDSVKSNSDSAQDALDKRPSKNKLNIEIKRYRSKSQQAIEDSKTDDLDDEFFTKY